MIKINYPQSKKEKDELDEKYWTLFSSKEEEYDRALLTLNAGNFLKKYSFKDIVLGDIKTLTDVYNRYKQATAFHEEIKDKILKIEDKKINKDGKEEKYYKNIFNYDQPIISSFFEEYDYVFNLKACHYCNLDSVHVYSDLDGYIDSLDFIKNASQKELESVDWIGETKAKKVVEAPNREFLSISDLKDNLLSIHGSLEDNRLEKRNHFTLDHFIPQSECGLLAISLYNFVPSCYVCNTKLKKTYLLSNNPTEVYKYSPTYDNFNKYGVIKFSLRQSECVNIFDYNNNKTNLLKKVAIDISAQKDNKSPEIFKLKQRYKVHKEKAIRLAYLKELYSDERVKEISEILNTSPTIVKRDIFNIPNLENEGCSKFQKDIALQLGIEI